jgi:hypothetical protein
MTVSPCAFFSDSDEPTDTTGPTHEFSLDGEVETPNAAINSPGRDLGSAEVPDEEEEEEEQEPTSRGHRIKKRNRRSDDYHCY